MEAIERACSRLFDQSQQVYILFLTPVVVGLLMVVVGYNSFCHDTPSIIMTGAVPITMLGIILFLVGCAALFDPEDMPDESLGEATNTLQDRETAESEEVRIEEAEAGIQYRPLRLRVKLSNQPSTRFTLVAAKLVTTDLERKHYQPEEEARAAN